MSSENLSFDNGTQTRLPTYFISHGGGPWPWIKDMMPWSMEPLEKALRSIPQRLPVKPKALLVVSAHWEENDFTLQTNPNPPMLYDYGGFPEFTYHIQYPAPGSPELAARTAELLQGAGIATAEDPRRGFDHGLFAPLYVMYPEADMPLVQLSLRHGYDPEAHLAAGRALAPLRDEGVLIVGSGLSFHNLRAFGSAGFEASHAFGDWLDQSVVDVDPTERSDRLRAWDRAPAARAAHPQEDHLLPLMVAVGAAEGERGVLDYHEDDFAGGIAVSNYRFG